jgi:hypothetical protein
MDFKGQRYFWVPRQNVISVRILFFFSRCGGAMLNSSSHLQLYNTAGGVSPEPIAKITEGPGSVSLEVTANVIHGGLLEVCVVATILFASGCNLE